MSITFSCIIPAKNVGEPKLQSLVNSIDVQDFPRDQVEIIIVGPEVGDPEQAKADGIKRARGEICGMFCSDNFIKDKTLFSRVWKAFQHEEDPDAVYEERYAYIKDDNSLNRYFSLIGCNDPVPFYLGKCDRIPWVEGIYKPSRYSTPSYGCNGFFVRRECFKMADLDHYYPMDAHVDMSKDGMAYLPLKTASIWHRTTDGNLIKFLARRYRYARDLYSDRSDRRWRMIDTLDDRIKLVWFFLSTIMVVPCFITSLRGYLKVRDFAWLLHWPVCLGFLLTYSFLALRNIFKYRVIFQRRSSYA